MSGAAPRCIATSDRPCVARRDLTISHTLAGSLATALGSLSAGAIVQALQRTGAMTDVSSYRLVILVYAALGAVLAFLITRVSSASEVVGQGEQLAARATLAGLTGLHEGRRIVLKLSSLFALDSFGGGFVIQSFAAYWFHLRFGVNPATLGVLFFAANVLAGISALFAARMAARFGLLNTMVATHLPSNVLLILIPLMGTLPLAALLLLVRFSISQMDVPTRQSYVMAVVRPEERSAAAGITGVARTLGAALSPMLAGLLFARPSLINVPFFIAGTLKMTYDVWLYREFRAVRQHD
ncbi:MAG: major facilitator superfamily 1 [Acidobacteria bacterium]|nr:major facilitator superfamily 1 [Acidobacteriota bacterium]